MRRIIIFSISLLIICVSAYSQKQYDFATIDAKITDHYTAGNWDSVIYYGNAGIADSIDYFYLRKHLGEAYYYKQNYARAISNFENAMNKNSREIATQEFLYYSYLFSGRLTDARAFQSKMSDVALKDINAKRNVCIDNIYFESGTSLNNNFSKNQNNDFNGKQNIFGSVEMSGNVSYGHLGFKALLGKKISVYAGATLMNEQKKTIYDLFILKPDGRIIRQRDTMVWKPLPMPGYYTHDTIIQNFQAFRNDPLLYKNDNTLQQQEVYVNCNIHTAKGLDIMPFVHFLSTRLTMTIPVYHISNFVAKDYVETHTQFHFPPPPMGTGGITDTVFYHDTTYTVKISDYTFQLKDTSFVNYSMGIVLNKNIGHFATSLFGSVSNLNGRKQNEIGVSATWFPLGNLNLYIGTSFTNYQQESSKKLVMNFLAGKKIAKKIWMEGNVTLGDMSNFTESNGFVVNNNPDVVKFRCGITPIIVFKNIDIIIRYQYLAKQESYFYQNESGGYIEGTFNYKDQLITGGIKWKL